MYTAFVVYLERTLMWIADGHVGIQNWDVFLASELDIKLYVGQFCI